MAKLNVWTTKTYDRLSRQYDWMMRIFFPVGEKGRRTIVEHLSGGSVLDVACGTGTLLAMAEEKGLRCYGIDLSPGMLDRARAKVPEADLRIASYYDIPFPDDSFEYVVATNALSGASIDARAVIVEMIRVCKPGGDIYLAEWPTATKDTVAERIIKGLARLNDDAPKDYLKIFRELTIEPDFEVLRKRYYVFHITKSAQH